MQEKLKTFFGHEKTFSYAMLATAVFLIVNFILLSVRGYTTLGAFFSIACFAVFYLLNRSGDKHLMRSVMAVFLGFTAMTECNYCLHLFSTGPAGYVILHILLSILTVLLLVNYLMISFSHYANARQILIHQAALGLLLILSTLTVLVYLFRGDVCFIGMIASVLCWDFVICLDMKLGTFIPEHEKNSYR